MKMFKFKDLHVFFMDTVLFIYLFMKHASYINTWRNS